MTIFKQLGVGDNFFHSSMLFIKLPNVCKESDLRTYNAFCLNTKLLVLFDEETIVEDQVS